MSSIHLPADIASNVDIESIVRRVLHELERGEAVGRNNRSAVPAVTPRKCRNCATSRGLLPAYDQASNDVPDPDTFSFAHRVITLEDLKAVPESAKTIQIPTGGILTPSVRDELRSRGVAVSRSSEKIGSGLANPKEQSSFRFIRLRHDDDTNVDLLAAIQKQILTRGVKHCDRAGSSVMLSSRPAAAIDRCYRDGVSAVMISRIEDVARFKNELNPSCYVIDLHHLNLMSIVNTIIQVARRDSGGQK